VSSQAADSPDSASAGDLAYDLQSTRARRPLPGRFLDEKETVMQSNLELFRQVLKSKINEAVAITGLRDSIRIHQVADPIDMTQQAAEREMAMQNLHRGAALGRQLRSAIDRLDDGSYGICLQCEEPISPKRLKAVPWAEFCISCQETADQSNSKREFNTNARELPEAA
jgi:DnaK suppressor protein